jgi:uncharacterized membrane protein YkoI|tara:strand:- start:2283 stop:2693 length:411 start_codon:yes stop_codon:yes gene_type:complete
VSFERDLLSKIETGDPSMTSPKHFLLALTLAGFVAAPAMAANDIWSNDDHAEHEAFTNAAVSLSDAITFAERETGARAISAEFEKEDGHFVFAVELLDSNGREIEVLIDSAVLRVIEIEGEDEGENDGTDSGGDRG